MGVQRQQWAQLAGKKALLHTYMLEQFSCVFLVVLQGEELGELLKDLILFWVMSKERS